MGQLHYITGAAGTGKTHTLTDVLTRWLEHNTLANHQKVLAITRMHGSRKRLRERLTNKSIHAQLSISTVDSFALHLVNRWRLSLGYSSPILPSNNGGFVKDEFGHRATFEEIMEIAAHLSKSPTVVKTIANSYPIILIDEFQDCNGNQLSLIKNLSVYIDLIIAADPFQALNGDESACDWIESIKEQEFVEITSLLESKRTSCKYIHEAANAILKNQPAAYSGSRLSFWAVPTYALAAWKVLPKRLLANENAVLIYPAQKAFFNLTKSVEEQNKKRTADGRPLNPFPWRSRLTDDNLEKQIYSYLLDSVKEGTLPETKKWKQLYDEARHLSKIKGYSDVPSENILKHVVKLFIQTKKYIDSGGIRYEATTIHGAKNREFDHVVIFWDNNLCTNFNDDQKRRLLYNAITRAKKSCSLVAIGTKAKIISSPVLPLLGEPEEPPKLSRK